MTESERNADLDSRMRPSDESLVTQATRLKDTSAFAELVRRYEQKILMLQRRLTGERALAEDLAQETFLRAWQKLDTFSGSGSFGGWLASLSYNVFRAHWRKTRRQQDEVPLGERDFGAPEHDETGYADLERLLGWLSREDQLILTLCYACGLSNAEAGEVMGMPAGTIKARIHRAKARIREQLAQPQPAVSTTAGNHTQADGSSASGTRVSRKRSRETRDCPGQGARAGRLTC